MMGEESQGMMLLAEGTDGKPHLINPEGLVPNGTRLR
jgi:tRNA-binding EMAP/Myf-like protein